MEPVLQPADAGMAPFAAPLIRHTMGVMADYLFGQDRALDVLEYLFRQGSNRLSHQFTDIAALEEMPAGILISYPARALLSLELPMLLQVLRFFGFSGFLPLAKRTLPMFNSREAEKDEYFISNIAVVPELRGRGLGTFLLTRAEMQAASRGFDRLSLTVDVENVHAFSLYERLGFKVVEMVENRILRKRIGYAGYYRMRKELV